MPQEKCIKTNKYLHAFPIWQFSIGKEYYFFYWYKIISLISPILIVLTFERLGPVAVVEDTNETCDLRYGGQCL